MAKVNLEDAKQRYAREWLAFSIAEEASTGELFGHVIAHNSDRRELHRELIPF